jgi:hypothetical protein
MDEVGERSTLEPGVKVTREEGKVIRGDSLGNVYQFIPEGGFTFLIKSRIANLTGGIHIDNVEGAGLGTQLQRGAPSRVGAKGEGEMPSPGSNYKANPRMWLRRITRVKDLETIFKKLLWGSNMRLLEKEEVYGILFHEPKELIELSGGTQALNIPRQEAKNSTSTSLREEGAEGDLTTESQKCGTNLRASVHQE